MIQLPIDLPYRTALGRADFLASACNEAALGWIERWPAWPAAGLVVYGPQGCGKTHLGHLWCERSGGVLIKCSERALTDAISSVPGVAPGLALDDVDEAPDVPFLHLYNRCVEHGVRLLILMRPAPASAPIVLADLASRLRALPAVEIAAPDDALIGAVLIKHFADRQMRVSPEVIRYLVRRMERSFAGAAFLAEQLDRLALSRGGPVTVPLARQLFDEIAAQSSMPSDLGVT